MSVNKVILVGRLGRDPESRFTASGQSVCNFSIATDEKFKDRSGEMQKRTEWHRIVAWGKLGEICQKYLKKGSQVYVEGRIQSRQWDDKEGNKRTSFDIIASEMRMLDKKADAAGAGAGGGSGMGGGGGRTDDEHSQTRTGGDDFAGGAEPVTDEDIPF